MSIETRLVGRRAELAGLDELLGGPGGSAMVLLGEAGSGKTALLDVAAAAAAGRGIRVLRVTGYEAESRYPFAGLHQLLLPALTGLENPAAGAEHVLRSVLGLPAAGAERPGSGGQPAEPDSAAVSAAAVAQACQGLLRYVNSLQRTLVLADDFQWLDTESARALSTLCRRLRPADVDLLLAIRGQSAPEELGVRTREHVLAPLTSAEASVLLDRTTTTLHGYARDTVLRQAAGNPLALTEFGPAAEAGAPARLGVFDDGPLPLPRRLEALYGARARELPPPTRRALLLASAAGISELADVLASRQITTTRADWVPAVEAGLVRLEAGLPVFIHPLMRSAVFQSASFSEQADAHRHLAAALAGWPERRAWHLARSIWHPDEEIAGMLSAVARDLSTRHRFHSAAAAWERSAEITPDLRDAYVRFGNAARDADSADHRQWAAQLAERAVTAGVEAGLGPAELSDVEQIIAVSRVFLGSDPDLVRDLIAAVRAQVNATTVTGTAALAATAAYYAPGPSQLAELRAILDAVPELAGPDGKETQEDLRLRAAELFYARVTVSPFLPREDPLANRGLLDHSGTSSVYTMPDSMFGAAAYLLDQPELAAQAIALVRGPRLERHLEVLNPTFLNMVASNNEMWGRWEEAVGQADEVIELSIERGERFNIAFGHITAGLLSVRQGRLDPARRHARAAERAGDGVSRSVPARTRHLQGLVALTEGDYQGAYALLRGVLLTEEQVPAHYHLSHYAVADFALAAQHTAQQQDAAAVLDRVVAHADAMTPGGACLSRRLRLLHELARALVADPADAAPLFQRALSPGAERWPFDQACARLHYGEHLRRVRRITEARPLLTAALGTFRELGAAPWAQRAETELRASGVSLGTDLAVSADAFAVLSPQQRAVAELAGRGLTNPQIGARLSISPKTVSIHLARVFQQLGLASRAQLRDLTKAP